MQNGPVVRVTYMSRPSTLQQASLCEDVAHIQWQSRKLNRLYGITGALLVSRHWFIQTIEGEAVAVFATLARINLDVRHEDIRIFEMTVSPTRLFATWAMHVGTMGHVDPALIARCAEGFRRPSPREAPLLVSALQQSVMAA